MRKLKERKKKGNTRWKIAKLFLRILAKSLLTT